MFETLDFPFVLLGLLAGIEGAEVAPLAGPWIDLARVQTVFAAGDKLAPEISRSVSLPLLHIADPTAAAILARGLATVGLLGTAFTMEQPFYKRRLEEQHGLTVLVPPAEDRAIVHQVIYAELCLGEVRDATRREYVRIMRGLVEGGAQGIILGCTEIMLLVGAGDTAVPVFDTTTLHAEAAVDFALGG